MEDVIDLSAMLSYCNFDIYVSANYAHNRFIDLKVFRLSLDHMTVDLKFHHTAIESWGHL